MVWSLYGIILKGAIMLLCHGHDRWCKPTVKDFFDNLLIKLVLIF